MNKTVKGILCVTVIAVMLLSLAACNGGIAGHYELASAQINGMQQEFPTGSGFYIELNEDGTGVLNIAGEAMEMRWEDDQIWPVTDPDDKVTFTVKGDTLTLDLFGNTATFKK